jgi:ankyrin repeat protein
MVIRVRDQIVRAMSSSSIKDGFIETLKYFIEKGNEKNSSLIHQGDYNEATPLHYAACKNNVEAAIILLQNGNFKRIIDLNCC